METDDKKRYCLALDLKNDPKKIQAYIDHHKNVWPEIKESIKNICKQLKDEVQKNLKMLD